MTGFFLFLFRWAHQPGGDVRAVPGEEGVADKGRGVHGGAVPGSRVRRGAGEGVHEARVQQVERRSQRRGPRLQHRHGPGRRDHRHLRARLHRLLSHRPQEERA